MANYMPQLTSRELRYKSYSYTLSTQEKYCPTRVTIPEQQIHNETSGCSDRQIYKDQSVKIARFVDAPPDPPSPRVFRVNRTLRTASVPELDPEIQQNGLLYQGLQRSNFSHEHIPRAPCSYHQMTPHAYTQSKLQEETIRPPTLGILPPGCRFLNSEAFFLCNVNVER